MKKMNVNKTFDDRKLLKGVLLLVLALIILPVLYIFVNALTVNSNYMKIVIEEGILLSYLATTFVQRHLFSMSGTCLGCLTPRAPHLGLLPLGGGMTGIELTK